MPAVHGDGEQSVVLREEHGDGPHDFLAEARVHEARVARHGLREGGASTGWGRRSVRVCARARGCACVRDEAARGRARAPHASCSTLSTSPSVRS